MKPSIVNRIKSNWTLKRLGKVAMTVAFTLVIAIFLLAMLGTVVQAAGLVDDTVNVANEYSRYPLENYQLDFYVDNSWGWLPWNWSDGIGKQVMYGLYAITNFIWTIKDRLQDKNNIMMNRPQNSLIFRLHIRNLNKPNKSVQQLSPIFQVQKWNAKAIPFKKKPFKSQQLQPLQQIELHNVQSQKNVRLLFKEYHYKIQEVDHQSKPPPLRKSVRNHEVENFSDWWFWIILDGLLTASVCCHFIFR